MAAFPAFTGLKDKQVLLASSSPRRIELFNRMGLTFKVVPSNFEEDFQKTDFVSPKAYTTATCVKKAQIVKELALSDATTPPPSLIVSADTIVVCKGLIYEKPADRADAFRMLKELSGKTIEAITAVTIMYRKIDEPSGEYGQVIFDECTLMVMEELTDDLINAYLDAGQGMDHSGALAYQSSGFLLVKSVSGCFYNLIGFPAARFYQEMVRIQDCIA